MLEVEQKQLEEEQNKIDQIYQLSQSSSEVDSNPDRGAQVQKSRIIAKDKK